MKKARNDPRPESYNIDIDTIELGNQIPTTNGWAARKAILKPLTRPSMCAIRDERDKSAHPTLGLFRPKQIKRLIITPSKAPDWSAQQKAILNQQTLDIGVNVAKDVLQKIPYDFFYEFTCEAPSCRGHKMTCTDWEMLEPYRRWRRDYGDEWEVKFRERYERDMIERYDTHFYVGTMHGHPKNWLIVGLFYPPKNGQDVLL